MLHGFKFGRVSLHWVWVLCIAVHMASCQGVLHRDDFSGIKFFPSMSKDGSDNTHQDQAIVGKKIDLLAVKRWFTNLSQHVDQYREELSAIFSTTKSPERNDPDALQGVSYDVLRMVLPFQDKKQGSSLDLPSINPGASLFLGNVNKESGLSRSMVPALELSLIFPCVKKSEVINWALPSLQGQQLELETNYIKFKIEHLGKESAIWTNCLVSWVLQYVVYIGKSMKVSGNNFSNLWNNQIYSRFNNMLKDEELENFFLIENLRKFPSFLDEDVARQIFDCSPYFYFSQPEVFMNHTKEATDAGNKIKEFLVKLERAIESMRGKSKDSDRILINFEDFNKQYRTDISHILTSMQELFGKCNKVPGTEWLYHYEESISQVFECVREKVEDADANGGAYLEYMVHSALNHASMLIGHVMMDECFNAEVSCVNQGIINALNFFYFLLEKDNMKFAFSKERVKACITSSRQRNKMLISIADMISSENITCSQDSFKDDMEKVLGIQYS